MLRLRERSFRAPDILTVGAVQLELRPRTISPIHLVCYRVER